MKTSTGSTGRIVRDQLLSRARKHLDAHANGVAILRAMMWGNLELRADL